jgi:hypothetical protein
LAGVRPQKDYDNLLRNTKCTNEDYQVIKRLGERLKLDTFAKTHEVYLWTDVLALADIMENFSLKWWEIFGICPFHSITIASAAYQSCLKWIGPVIQSPSLNNGGMEFVDLLDKSILGGLVWAKEVYYLKTTEQEELCGLDLTSLYPTVQARFPMPIGNFVKLEPSLALAHQLLRNWTFEDEYGYLIECTFHVPPQFHDDVDLPPVGKFDLDETWVTDDQKEGFVPGRKLVPYLGVHTDSGRHIALLQTWIKHCHIELLEVKSIWRFDQRKVFTDFIQKLFDLRQSQKSETGRSVIKIGLNSVWGKFLEDVRKHSRSQLCSNVNVFQRKVAKKSTTDWCILDHQDFLGIYSTGQSTVTLDRPKQVAWAVLDLSKVIVYTWWYHIKAHWPGAKLYYTDTDSLYVKLPEPLLHKAMEWNRSPLAHTVGTFDLGNLAESPGAVLGSLKNELAGNICREGVFLGSKMYALRCEKQDYTKAKGIPGSVDLRFEKFKAMLGREAQQDTESYYAMRVKRCESVLVHETKKGLSFSNDKVKIWRTDDGFVTRPHGHICHYMGG